MEKLGSLGIPVVNYPAEELENEIAQFLPDNHHNWLFL